MEQNNKKSIWPFLLNVASLCLIVYLFGASYFKPDEDSVHKIGWLAGVFGGLYFAVNYFYYQNLRKNFVEILSFAKLQSEEAIKFKKKFSIFDLRFNTLMIMAAAFLVFLTINTYGLFTTFRNSELLCSISFVSYLVFETVVTPIEKKLKEEIVNLKVETEND